MSVSLRRASLPADQSGTPSIFLSMPPLQLRDLNLFLALRGMRSRTPPLRSCTATGLATNEFQRNSLDVGKDRTAPAHVHAL
jgi:hypothetical protein